MFHRIVDKFGSNFILSDIDRKLKLNLSLFAFCFPEKESTENWWFIYFFFKHEKWFTLFSKLLSSISLIAIYKKVQDLMMKSDPLLRETTNNETGLMKLMFINYGWLLIIKFIKFNSCEIWKCFKDLLSFLAGSW
jgi:hypothetical protein